MMFSELEPDKINDYESLAYFRLNENYPKLVKYVGTSQYTDGVRIDKEFHDIFNPPNTDFYVRRGTTRPIKILFNNKIFKAEYRYENQKDNAIELQSIRFRKELKAEFKKVFPDPIGEFVIQQGVDLNHFIFSHTSNLTIYDEEDEYPEGTSAYKTHKVRERNNQVINKAKERFKRNNEGRLFCEVCGFDFFAVYGARGEAFIEGHHNKFVSEMADGEKTKIEDITMLCSNCHRMIHKSPKISVKQLADLVKEKKE